MATIAAAGAGRGRGALYRGSLRGGRRTHLNDAGHRLVFEWVQALVGVGGVTVAGT